MCDKSYANLASHKRKVHDVFTFTQEEDEHGLLNNVWLMYKNDTMFERYIPYRLATDRNMPVYKSTLAVRTTYLLEYPDPEGTFEVIANDNSVVIKRRPMIVV